jgi:hypothetical protein
MMLVGLLQLPPTFRVHKKLLSGVYHTGICARVGRFDWILAAAEAYFRCLIFNTFF